MPTEGRSSVVLEGNNFGHGEGSGTIVLTYGGEFGTLYTATACRYLNGKIACQTASGAGFSHNWLLSVGGLKSSVAVTESAYARPTIRESYCILSRGQYPCAILLSHVNVQYM